MSGVDYIGRYQYSLVWKDRELIHAVLIRKISLIA
jgi:hypothetical protein